MTSYEDVEGDLSKLSQTGSVDKFQGHFKDLMNKVTGISKTLIAGFSVTQLKYNIHRELQFHRPPTLMETFAMVRAYDAHLSDNPSPSKGWSCGPFHIPTQIFKSCVPARPKPM